MIRVAPLSVARMPALPVADAAFGAPRGAGPVPGRASGSCDRGVGGATRRFLADLRVALSVSDRAGVSGSAESERMPKGRASGGRWPGAEPHDLERIAALVALAQQGDAEAFGVLYERHVGAVYRYVYVRVGSRQTAEDLTSETFVRALRRIDSFSWQGRDIAAWFITIARNLITDHAKSARYRLEVTTADMLDADDGPDGPETEVLRRLRDSRLIEAIRTLKPEQAECLVLRFLHGLSLAECAEVLGTTEGAVKQRQLRALRSLRRELGDDAF